MADPDVIQYRQYFYLRHEQTGQYICAAYSGNRYYFPKLGERGKAKLQLRGGTGSLKSGDSIKIRSMEKVIGKKDCLGAFGDSPDCYYWTDNYDYGKQHWIISKLHSGSDNFIRYGDRVRISNIAYKNQRFILDPNDPEFLTTQTGGEDAWILESTVARPRPAVEVPVPTEVSQGPQVINAPQQSCENIPEGEAEQIKELADLMGKLMDKRYPPPKKVLRGVHPKAHGCVNAVFEVNKDIAKDLQIGLFANPGKTYQTRIRFSNASSGLGPDTIMDPKSKSRKHSSRGMAIKILDVEGKVLLDDQGEQHQDFLMITEPAFAFANVADYLRLNQVLFKNDDKPDEFFAPIDPRVPGFSDAERERTKRSLVLATSSKPVANLLGVQYFSAAPFLFGPDRVMKVSAKPCIAQKPQVVPENPSADYLRKALIETMSQDKDVCFDFMVQVRGKDEEGLNIENASTEWEEKPFPFMKVAKITIPAPQKDIDSPDAVEHGEKLCYSPWHSLVEHQPLGGINRLRKAVYLASQAHRASRTSK